MMMSFELKNALMIFQRLANNTIQEYLDVFTITYLDDILVYLETLEEHKVHVQKVLKVLEK